MVLMMKWVTILSNRVREVQKARNSTAKLCMCENGRHFIVTLDSKNSRHQSLSILLYVAPKTPHCGRTTPPSCTEWWSCIFWERVWPLEIQRSDMVAFTLRALKKLYSSVWKTEGRTCSKRLERSFIDLSLRSAQISTSLYIEWYIYHHLQ